MPLRQYRGLEVVRGFALKSGLATGAFRDVGSQLSNPDIITKLEVMAVLYPWFSSQILPPPSIQNQ